MALSIQSTWQPGDATGLRCTLDEQVGGTTTVNVTTTNLCHTAVTSANTGTAYSAFASEFKSALDSASPGTNSYNVDLTVSNLTAFYTVQATGVSFKLTFTSHGARGTHLRQVLGFDGNIETYGTSHSSFWIPYYLIVPARGGKARATDDYEPDDVTEDEEADDGTAYSISRTTAPTYNDWTFPLELRDGVFSRRVTSTAPGGYGKPIQWTYQHLFEHVRGDRPFLFVDSGDETTVHQLRASAARFKPERAQDGFDDYWDIRFETRVLGSRL